jgi:ketosteroid isomerase-like protein
MHRTDVVRAAFDAYVAQDRTAAVRLLADDYTFTSPQDDYISKAEFMERCFPTADRVRWQRVVELTGAGEDGVFIMYEYELKTGGRHRNAEFSMVRDGQLTQTLCFFGGQVRPV